VKLIRVSSSPGISGNVLKIFVFPGNSGILCKTAVSWNLENLSWDISNIVEKLKNCL